MRFDGSCEFRLLISDLYFVMINILVVDDSKVSRMFLVHLLESDPELRVIGTAGNGQEALDFVSHTLPDVVLMDIHMPTMDGFEATRRIMETHPLPIIICTATTNPREVATMFRSMEAGAIASIEKPTGIDHADFEERVATLIQTVKLMSEVKVVRRWPRSQNGATRAARGDVGSSSIPRIRMIGIGASTGGPPALQTILSELPKDFPVPILIVQHISEGFLGGLAEWLNQTTGLKISIASYGVRPLPGQVYLAPDGYNMGVGPDECIRLSKDAESMIRPSASYLFRSLAETCGPAAVGVLLTGMGKDGASELKMMKDCGAVTIAQDKESSVVHGMPGEAIALGGASQILPVSKIADALLLLVGQRNGKVHA